VAFLEEMGTVVFRDFRMGGLNGADRNISRSIPIDEQKPKILSD